jgi:hypothetical protein
MGTGLQPIDEANILSKFYVMNASFNISLFGALTFDGKSHQILSNGVVRVINSLVDAPSFDFEAGGEPFFVEIHLSEIEAPGNLGITALVFVAGRDVSRPPARNTLRITDDGQLLGKADFELIPPAPGEFGFLLHLKP